MTQRSAHAEPLCHASPDFTDLTCAEAREYVRRLVCTGLPEATVADLVGWTIGDVRRALWPASAQAADPHALSR